MSWKSWKFWRITVLMISCFIAVQYVLYQWPSWTRVSIRAPLSAMPTDVEAGSRVVYGNWIGFTESQIEERIGTPTHRRAGHYGVPGVKYRFIYPDAVTATYVRTSGILYLSYCIDCGRLVCFRSDWFPSGTVF